MGVVIWTPLFLKPSASSNASVDSNLRAAPDLISLSVVPDRVEMKPGQIRFLRAVGNPSQTLIDQVGWKSSDTSVLIVLRGGEIRAHKPGHVRVEAFTMTSDPLELGRMRSWLWTALVGENLPPLHPFRTAFPIADRPLGTASILFSPASIA